MVVERESVCARGRAVRVGACVLVQMLVAIRRSGVGLTEYISRHGGLKEMEPRTHLWLPSIEVDHAVLNHRPHRVLVALLGGIYQCALKVRGRHNIPTLRAAVMIWDGSGRSRNTIKGWWQLYLRACSFEHRHNVHVT